jgi:SlyX protein
LSEQVDIQYLQAQLVELQTQVAFQEETIGELNSALGQQQRDISELQRHWDVLRQQHVELQARVPAAPVDEKPPHY